MKWDDTNLHSPANALEAARLSALVYPDSEGDIDADIRWHDDKTDTEAFGWATDDQIIIVFRGTSSVKDAKIDLKFHKVPFSVADTADTAAFSLADIKKTNFGKAHRGFLMAVGSVWRSIRLWLNRVREIQPIFVCGHSLGAANACILALRLALDEMPVAAVYTFGCPRVGDTRFARIFDELIRHYRYVNHNDVVTRMPPWFTGARHTGFRYYFNRHGHIVIIGWWHERWDRFMGRMTQSVIDGANDHRMTGYLASFEKDHEGLQ